MRQRRVVVLCFCLLGLIAALGLLLSGAARAQDPAAGRWAVIIGVDRYDDPQISSLRYASADARAVAEALVHSGPWRADHVVLLSSDAEDPARRPTRNNILSTLRWLDGLEGADTVLFYFSGHGSRESTDGVERDYLFPSDTLALDPAASGLAVDDVARRLEALDAPRKLIVLDACRNQTRPDTRAVIRPMSWEPEEAEGAYILLATKPGNYSYEDPRLGMGRFTYAFTVGLAGNADGGLGAPPDGQVTIQEVFAFTKQALAIDGARGRPQTPWMRGEGTDDWALVAVRAAGATGRVEVIGDAHGVWLEDLAGNRYSPDLPVPAGRYTVKARFKGFSTGSSGEVEVLADSALTVRCAAIFLSCNIVLQPEGGQDDAP